MSTSSPVTVTLPPAEGLSCWCASAAKNGTAARVTTAERATILLGLIEPPSVRTVGLVELLDAMPTVSQADGVVDVSWLDGLIGPGAEGQDAARGSQRGFRVLFG